MAPLTAVHETSTELQAGVKDMLDGAGASSRVGLGGFGGFGGLEGHAGVVTESLRDDP